MFPLLDYPRTLQSRNCWATIRSLIDDLSGILDARQILVSDLDVVEACTRPLLSLVRTALPVDGAFSRLKHEFLVTF